MKKGQRSNRKDKRVLTALRKYWPQVNRVVDARKRLIVHVNNDDVAGAQPKDAANCVMARACRREQEVDAVLVFPSRAYILQGTLATRFTVPETMTREVAILDRGGQPATGNFHFAPPSGRARMGVQQPHSEGKVDGSRPRPRPLQFQHVHLHTEGLRQSLLR